MQVIERGKALKRLRDLYREYGVGECGDGLQMAIDAIQQMPYKTIKVKGKEDSK